MGKEKTYRPGQENLTASDVLKLAGLTYRQLHDWENRAGIIDSERAANESWRNFTFEEVISLAICARLREHFALPLERTGIIYKWLLGKNSENWQKELVALGKKRIEEIINDPPKVKIVADWIREGAKHQPEDKKARDVVRLYVDSTIIVHGDKPVIYALKLAQFGLPSYLITTVDSSAIFSEDNLVKSVATRSIENPTIVLPLFPFFDAIQSITKIPKFTLDTFYTSYQDYWNQLKKGVALSDEEKEVVRLIRGREYQRLVAHVSKGKVIRVERESDVLTDKQIAFEAQILAAINEGNHQSVTIDKRDGEVVRISRKESIKLD